MLSVGQVADPPCCQAGCAASGYQSSSRAGCIRNLCLMGCPALESMTGMPHFSYSAEQAGLHKLQELSLADE